MRQTIILLLALLSIVVACKRSSTQESEDKQAKQLLQGLWTTDDTEEPAMLVKGDSIYYPDSASMPVRFWIFQDSIYMQGQNLNGYKILKQTNAFFSFNNQNGDEVNLFRSSNKDLMASFGYHVYAMNLFDKSGSDTIVSTDMGFYDCQIRTCTTSERVIKSTYNDNGIEVDNAYLDNVSTLTLRSRDSVVYKHDFLKQEFSNYIPRDFIAHCILRNLEFARADRKALFFNATIGIPDASSGYVVEVRITPDGKMSKRLR